MSVSRNRLDHFDIVEKINKISLVKGIFNNKGKFKHQKTYVHEIFNDEETYIQRI